MLWDDHEALTFLLVICHTCVHIMGIVPLKKKEFKLLIVYVYDILSELQEELVYY